MASAQDIFAFIVVIDIVWLLPQQWWLISGHTVLFSTDVPHRSQRNCSNPKALAGLADLDSWRGLPRHHSPQVLAGLFSSQATTCVLACWNTHDDCLLGESCLEAGD